jgi:hypothetical protein
VSESFGVRRLMQVVDLLKAGYRELLDKGGYVDTIRDQADPAEPAGDPPESAQVDIDDRADARPLDLDDDVEQAGVS